MSDVTIHSIWTVLMLVLFIAILAWAWSSRRKGDFDEAANMILDDSDLNDLSEESKKPSVEDSKGEK